MVDLDSRGADVHLPALLPAVHRRGRRAALPRGARPLPVLPRTSTLGAGQWDELEIPVGLAFFFRNSELGRTVAFYPGPAGATESELPLGRLGPVVGRQPGAGPLRPDVEALLVRVPGPDGPGADVLPGADRRAATSWSGRCAGSGAASTAARRPRARSTTFFADRVGAAAPAPAAPSEAGR